MADAAAIAARRSCIHSDKSTRSNVARGKFEKGVSCCFFHDRMTLSELAFFPQLLIRGDRAMHLPADSGDARGQATNHGALGEASGVQIG